MTDTFTKKFLDESLEIIRKLDAASIEATAEGLASVRNGGGRLFILGVGGSAGHAGHAVNDFRKICGFEAYAPTDNVSELTARVNDEGWDTCFSEWLKGSRLRKGDGLLIFSVGGGNREKNVSVNLVRSLELAREVGAKIFGIVGRDGGFTKQVADACVVIPTVAAERVTPHTEGFAAVVWHLLVSHPELQRAATKWESTRDGEADDARRDPRSRRHAHRRRARRGDRRGHRRVPPRPAAPALRRRRGHARAPGRGVRARDRDQPAGAGEGAVLGRRREEHQRRARLAPRLRGRPHRGARGVHAPPRRRARGRRLAGRQVRLPQATAGNAEHAHDAPGRRPRQPRG